MITEHDKKLAQQACDEYDERIAAICRNNESTEFKLLESALKFVSPEATREDKLFQVVLTAANKLRLGDPAGALLTLEQGLRL